MTLPQVALVVPDGLGKLAVRSAAWRWTEGDDVTIPVRVVHQDGSPYVLSDLTTSALAFWESELDGLPKLQVDFSIDDGAAGLAHFSVGEADLPAGIYAVGARFVDAALGRRDTVLLPGRAEIDRALATLATSASPTPTPAAPTVSHVATFADLPDPADQAWRFFVTDANGSLYYSNGSSWIFVVGDGP